MLLLSKGCSGARAVAAAMPARFGAARLSAGCGALTIIADSSFSTSLEVDIKTADIVNDRSKLLLVSYYFRHNNVHWIALCKPNARIHGWANSPRAEGSDVCHSGLC
jgi:hypothetical protein